uniref:Cytochrome b n=1 Tax=Solanum lycopersicum TaxID=4081 RepID=K4AUE8_SOLLC
MLQTKKVIQNHFLSLHHLLPFILVGASLLHLAALHQYGSNNALGSSSFGSCCYLFFHLDFYAPNVLGHADNYIPVIPMSTPPHIVPE